MNRLLAALLAAWAAAVGAAPPPAADPVCELPDGSRVHPGTLQMVERLARLRAEADPRLNQFLSRERAELARAALATGTRTADLLRARYDLAMELLNAGEPAAAIAEFGALYANAVRTGGVDSRGMLQILLGRAVAELRRGELDNCLDLHNAESCLFPLSPAARHRRPAGSAAALETLADILRRNPARLDARWLYNVAAMTLGRYPDGVPEAWRIPDHLFDSEQPFPRLPDAAIGLGLDLEGLAGGVIADDFDNDGNLDLFVSEWGAGDQIRFFRNNGDGSFTERTRAAGLTGLTGGLNLIQADYDNDGWVDVFVLRGAWAGAGGRQPNSLLRNRGDGTFEDVTEAAGVLSFHPTQTAVWFDFDGDGWLDLFIGNETSEAGGSHPCELYRNNRDGTFTEMAAAAGLAVRRFVKAVAAGDYDDDGRPDLYLSIRSEGNLLFRNLGPAADGQGWRFEEAGARAGVREPVHSFPAWFFDFDNDGRLDLFVSGYRIDHVGDVLADLLGQPHRAERARLYRNRGDGTFADVTREAGLHRVLHTMGSNFGDLDADGFPDLYLGTGDPDLATLIPNRLFRNDGGRRFLDVTTAAGVGHLQKGHAVAFADFDNDGDVDLYASIGGAYQGDRARNVMFENPGTANRLVKLRLVGTRSNRPAIGARLALTLHTPAGERRVYRWVNSGGSFGANPLRQEIGVADATNVTAAIRWPSGAEQTVPDLRPGQAWTIREGTADPEPIRLRPAVFARQPTAPRHEHPHDQPPSRAGAGGAAD